MDKLKVLQSQLTRVIGQLTDARFAAQDAGNNDKAEAARQQAEKLTKLTSKLQIIINHSLSVNIGAVADGLEKAVEDQVAFGLLTAARTLAAAVEDLDGRKVEAVPTAPPASPSSSFSSDSAPVPTPTPLTRTESGGPTRPAGRQRVAAKPGAKQAVVQAIIDGASREALDPIAVLSIVATESDFSVDAQNPRSSAGGLFQFIDATWTENGGQPVAGRGGIGNGIAAGAPLDEQVRIGCRFTAHNRDALKGTLGRAPTAGDLYMAHQQGRGGARAILSLQGQRPTAPVTDAISADAAKNNGLDGMTVTEARDKFANLMRVHRDEVMALVDLVPQAPAAATGRVGSQAASAALDEMEMFARKDGRVITETEAPLEARVLGYFSEVGMGDVKRGDEKPWSAAFISHCFREAGAALPTLPVNSANHAAYIHQALAARKAGQNDAPIVYFDQGELAPRIGDLVGFSRDENVRDRDDIEKLNGAFFPSHTDLVLDVGPGTIRVIGGNKSQTIKTVSIRRDENGHMVSDKYFFVLRVNA